MAGRGGSKPAQVVRAGPRHPDRGRGSTDVWAIGWGRAAQGARWGPLAVRWDGVSWKRAPSPGVLAFKHHGDARFPSGPRIPTTSGRSAAAPSCCEAAITGTAAVRRALERQSLVDGGGTEHRKGGTGLSNGRHAARRSVGRRAAPARPSSVLVRPPSSCARTASLDDAEAAEHVSTPATHVHLRLRSQRCLGRRQLRPGDGLTGMVPHGSLFHRDELGLAGTRVGDSINAISATPPTTSGQSRTTATMSHHRTVRWRGRSRSILHWDGTRWSRSAAAPYQQP